MTPPLTTDQVAEKLGISPGAVRALIRRGRLKADRFGRDYMVDPKDLAAVKDRKPGRPAGKGGPKKPPKSEAKRVKELSHG